MTTRADVICDKCGVRSDVSTLPILRAKASDLPERDKEKAKWLALTVASHSLDFCCDCYRTIVAQFPCLDPVFVERVR